MGRIALFIISAALLFLTFRFFTPITSSGDLGLLVSSPNMWKLSHLSGWLINTLLIFLSAGLLSVANKNLNFVPETKPIMPFLLLLLISCNCISTSTLSTSTLLLFCNILSFFIILSTYEEENATKEFFIAGSLPAIGAMFQYAFLFMIPVYIGAGLVMKSFRWREFIAFIFGILAPYWIAIGMGLVSPLSFKLPQTLTIFNQEAVESDIFYTLLASGAMAFIGIITALYNGVKLFSRNSRLRSMHVSINLMGAMAILATIFDFNNFVAYFGTLSLWLAIETSTLFYLYRFKYPSVGFALIAVLFLPLYILAL